MRIDRSTSDTRRRFRRSRGSCRPSPRPARWSLRRPGSRPPLDVPPDDEADEPLPDPELLDEERAASESRVESSAASSPLEDPEDDPPLDASVAPAPELPAPPPSGFGGVRRGLPAARAACHEHRQRETAEPGRQSTIKPSPKVGNEEPAGTRITCVRALTRQTFLQSESPLPIWVRACVGPCVRLRRCFELPTGEMHMLD